MNMKKTLAFLLAAQMLLASFAACSKDTPDETKDSTETDPVVETSAPDDAETEFDRRSVSDELPEMTFGGRDFRFLVDDKYAYQLYAEEASGDTIEDAVYERNQRIESRFDTKITYQSSLGKESQDLLVQYAQTNEHVAEACAYEQYMGNTPAIYFCWSNWADIPHLNFDKPWWNKQSIEDHIINDYVFNIAGDLSLSSIQMTWCIAFNADLMQDWGYSSDDLYETAFAGEWTLDKMIEVTSSLWTDSNGDGQLNDGDYFGFGTNVAARNEEGEMGRGCRTIPWIPAMGERDITVGEDRRSLTVTLGTEKMYKALEKLVNFHNNSVGVNMAATNADFANGYAGMMVTMFDAFYTDFSDVGFATGVLPLPKYDTAQEKYQTSPDTMFTMFGLPSTLPVEDYEFVGIMMEVLNAESWKTVYPSYYDGALKGRYSTDENMAEMIELIADSRIYSYSILCAQSLGAWKPAYTICYLIADNNTDLASIIAESSESWENSLTEILTFFDVE